ncbi:MAG: CHAT domain-containing tetratricopeptide repeat protein [Balneolaceae bacterium]
MDKTRFKTLAFCCLGACLLNMAPAFAQGQVTADELFSRAYHAWLDADNDTALRQFREVTGVLMSESRWSRVIESELYVSAIFRERRDYDRAAKKMQWIREVAGDYLSGDDPLYSRIFQEEALLSMEKGELKSAMESADHATRWAESGEADPVISIKAFTVLGEVWHNLGNYQKALELYQKALAMVENIPDWWKRTYGRTLVHNNLGVTYRKIGQLDQAMEHYKKQRTYLREIYRDDHPLIATNHNNIGTLYYIRGDVAVAVHHFLRTANLMESNYGTTHPLVATAYNNAGSALVELEMIEEATQYLERAQEIKLESLGMDHIDTAIGFSNLASLHMESGRYESALQYYNQSLTIRLGLFEGEHPDLISIFIQRGQLYIEMDEPEKGLADFHESLRIGKATLGEFHPDIANIYYHIGNAHRSLSQHYAALRGYQNAVMRLVPEFKTENLYQNPNSVQTEHPRLLLRVLSAKSNLLKMLHGRFQQTEELVAALESYLLSIKLVGDLQVNFQNEVSKLTLIDRYYDLFEGALSSTMQLYKETGDKEYLQFAYQILEMSKARVAQELLISADHPESGNTPEMVRRRDRETRSELSTRRHELILEVEKSGGLHTQKAGMLQDSLLQAHADWVEWVDRLKRDHPLFYQSKYNRKWTTLDELRNEVLDEDQVVLSYFLGEEDIYLMLISRTHVSLRQIGSTNAIPELISELHTSLEARNKSRYKQVAWQLYDKVLKPVEKELNPYHQLLILPDHQLYHLPFELLFSRPTEEMKPWSWPYLIRNYQISYAPSLEIFLSTRRGARRPDDQNMLAVAPWAETGIKLSPTESDRYFGSLSSLPLSRYEVEEIAGIHENSGSLWSRLWGDKKTDLLINYEATVADLKQRDLTQYRYVHFATHAFIHETYPTLSGIMMAPNTSGRSMIYLNDILNMDFEAELVVLSACETGRGSLARGEGVIGFTRAFLSSGVENLMVSLWKVNDRSSAALMTTFYRELLTGSGSGEALRRAKLSLIESSETAFPTDWASFILIGGS